MLTLVAIAIVIVTFVAIIKGYEARFVLMVSGVVMATIGGNPLKAVDAFSTGLINPNLTPLICVTMGFSLCLDYTGCSEQLVNLCTNLLRKVTFILIPGTIILVWIMNIALLSASGLAAAVGAILIPTLMRSGIHPAMAASAVAMGTWGSSVTPANPFVAQVGDIAGGIPVFEIIGPNAPKIAIAMLVSVAVLTAIAIIKKENGAGAKVEIQSKKVNYLMAIVPIIPIVLIFLSSPVIAVLPKISLTNCMLIGVIICLIVTHPKDVKGFWVTFFKGAGNGFAAIVCLIAAACVFTAGMNVIGLTGALIKAMAGSTAIAKVSAVMGPLGLAAVSGSGNAAVLAFNGSVTPHAAEFGMSITDMGMSVQAAGMLGRCMSPVAGVCIICAQMAGVSPMDIAKRNALPVIAAGIAMIVLILL